jgi:hypothetical protein
MESSECCEYLSMNELPSCLNFNINKTETIDYNKINYNDFTINIIRQKRHKYLLQLPYYDNYLEGIIKIANSEKPIKQLDDMIELPNITSLRFDN